MVRELSVVRYRSYGLKVGSSAAIARIKVASATLEFSVDGNTNTAPTDDVNLKLQFYVHRNNRQLGARAASATIKATSGNTLANPGSFRRVPLLNANIQQAAAIADSETSVSYLGSTDWKFVDFVSERINGLPPANVT